MIYPKTFEEKLEFHKIREYIKKNCIGILGSNIVDNISFSSDYGKINTLLNQTEEFRKILVSSEFFPATEYSDFGPYLVKASKIDAYLSDEEFHNLKLSLTTSENILAFFSKNISSYPELSLLTVGIYLNPLLLKEINRVIDEHGKVRDNASPELNEIRSSLRKQHFKVRKIMDRMLGEYITEGYSNEDANVTIRNGRLVLPVRSEFKRNTGGFIHDESASGQTAYIEPASALEINNDILDLEHQEKREVIKILSRLTNIIRPEIGNMRKCIDFLGMIDFIRAKAKWAISIDAVRPEIIKKPAFKWQKARHPLLYLSHRSVNKPVIPLDLILDKDSRILIISGPNAGGKSVCLKTVGIIQYMMQCGLLVPMSESSTMGIFSSILVDIGDEQSIESDLSTYSSHLINMKAFIAYAAQKTLFLIDEFGTGTEPQFGGAIAESILDLLLESKAFGIITTHYSNLKKYGGEHPGVANGAMRFDIDKMEPLFLLDIGRPGSSFAIEIAAKIGLPESILNKAKQKAGYEHVNYEKLLGELEHEKRKLDENIKQFSSRERELKKMVSEYEELRTYLDNKKQEIIKEAKVQAQEILKEANKTVEQSIREIKESQADKTVTRSAREKIENIKRKVRSGERTRNSPLALQRSPKELTVGSMARIRDQDTVGQIISIKGKITELAAGQLIIKIPMDRLEPISMDKLLSVEFSSKKSFNTGLNLTEKMQHFSNTLDLRGRRGNEAIAELDHYIDQALYLNKRELRILHGKGNGILRKLVREQLMQYNFIESVRDEEVERGGDGVTVVTLK